MVIYLENHSFDNLYGEFARAENLASAQAAGAPALTRFADGTQARADHLKDEDDMMAAIAADTLHAVTF